MDWRLVVAQHAAERKATQVHRELARGLGGLATVAATAPWLGFLWTIWIIASSFTGISGDRTSTMLAITAILWRAMIPSALGLAPAIWATWGYRHFRAHLTQFDLEMRVAAETLPALIAAGLRAGS